jgi:hypothetical protein
MDKHTVSDEAVEAASRVIADIVLEDEFEGDAASEWRRVAPIMRAALEAAAPFMREAPAPLSQAQPAPPVGEAQFPRVWAVVEVYRRRHEGPGDPSLPSCEVCEMLRVLDRALSASTPEEKP